MNTILTGLVEFLRSSTENNPLPFSDFKNDTERTVYCGGINYAPFNGIVEKTAAPLTPKFIQETTQLFSSKKLPFVWWMGDPVLENYGFQLGGTMKGIAVNLNHKRMRPLQFPANLNDVRIEEACQENDLEPFCRVIGECFGFTPPLEEQYRVLCNTAMEREWQRHFVAYVNDIPVATATLSTLPQSAGIWNCATLPAYRKKGLGKLLCWAATLEAQKLKYQEVMAILMPKGLAWGVFKSLGYQEKADLPFYIYGSSADELEK